MNIPIWLKDENRREWARKFYTAAQRERLEHKFLDELFAQLDAFEAKR